MSGGEEEERERRRGGGGEFLHSCSLCSGCRQMYSLFVGDLTPEVDDGMLYEFFYNRYPSCRGGKVVLDSMGNSK